MKSETLKAILFDFDGTLRHHIPMGGDVFTDYVISLGFPVTNEDRLRAARWEHFYFANSLEIQSDQKLIVDGDQSAFWIKFGQRRLVALGLPPSIVEELSPKVSAHMRTAYKPEVWMPEELHTLLPALKEAGYTLGVVSNRSEPYHESVEELGLQDHFDVILAAGEINSWKPDTKIFHHAVELANSKPEQTLYIGDNYYADIVGAHRAGLQPVLYDRLGIFADANCPIIDSFKQLPAILERI
ncbi:MAG: hypothetical protein Kow002_02080 [Anaerolineales bacterium]